MVNKQSFIHVLSKLQISAQIIKKNKERSDSPLSYAFDVLSSAIKEGNDLDHSLQVIQNCKNIIKESKLVISKNDRLVLFYASLLHDIDKIESSDIVNDITKRLKKKCTLFTSKNSGHGIKSAHYLKCTLRRKKISFYGLDPQFIRKVFNVISFHYTGYMHPCFLPKEKTLQDSEVLTCLIFWLADIADGHFRRTKASQTASKDSQSAKTKARTNVDRIRIDQKAIVWLLNKQTQEIEDAAEDDNKKLEEKRLLLQAFNLPSQIYLQKKGGKYRTSLKPGITQREIVCKGLSSNISIYDQPLLISDETLPGLYEKIVHYFYRIKVENRLSYSNYFGPIVLEVKNARNDNSDNVNIRNEKGKDINIIKKYTEQWLDDKEGAEKNFYFGYTHGQRIYRLLYPDRPEDFDENATNSFQDWHGKRNQLDNVAKLLKTEKFDCRKAYVVIYNSIIDTPGTKFYKKWAMSPSLLAIHFRIEKDENNGGYRLSAFAFLRAQELSTFFLVNYFEMKSLIEKLKKKLARKFPGLGIGRIVMMSSLSYFDPNTLLLDRPKICVLPTHQLEEFGRNIVTQKNNLISLLEDFRKDYVEIQTDWMRYIIKHLPKKREFARIKKEMKKLKKRLDGAEKKRGEKHSALHPAVTAKKQSAINSFIRILNEEI